MNTVIFASVFLLLGWVLGTCTWLLVDMYRSLHENNKKKS